MISNKAKIKAGEIISNSSGLDKDRIPNDVLIKSAMEFLSQNPTKFFIHGFRHCINSIPRHGNIYKADWLGSVFAARQLELPHAVERFVNKTGQKDIDDNFYNKKYRGVETHVPFGFNATQHWIGTKLYVFFFWPMVVSAFLSLALICFRSALLPIEWIPQAFVAIACFGYLLFTSLTAAVIARYAVTAEALILCFGPLFVFAAIQSFNQHFNLKSAA